MNQPKNNETKEVSENIIETLCNRALSFFNKDPDTRKKKIIVTMIISLVLLTVASLPFPEFLMALIPPIIGLPGGVLLFFVGLWVLFNPEYGTQKLLDMRDDFPFKKRLVVLGVVFGVFALLLMLSSSFLPVGLGGGLMIFVLFSVAYLARRTDYEKALAQAGMVDPREFKNPEQEEQAYINQRNVSEDDVDYEGQI